MLVATLFVLVLFTSQISADLGCDGHGQALGMQNGAIGDEAITASSWEDANHKPTFGRLKSPEAWCSDRENEPPYLEISLDEVYQINRILTQGGGPRKKNVRVMKYEIRYATTPGKWKVYQPNEGTVGTPHFARISAYDFGVPLIAKKIRIYAFPKVDKACLRVELCGSKQPAPCQDPGHPVDGVTVGNDFTHEQTVSFTCARGLILEGAKSSTCWNGSWSNDVPKCHKRCADPGEPENGVRMDHNFTFGQIVRFRCNAHFSRQGARAIRCVDGAWDKPTPRCSQCADDLASETKKLAHWKFLRAKLITGLELAMKANAAQCELFWRIDISAPGRWAVYTGDDGQDKIITIGARGTLEMSFKKPFVATGVKFECAGKKHAPDLKSVSLRGCDGISDCVLVGSKVWVKTHVLDKRSVYERKTVIGIHVNNGTVEAKVSLGSRKKYMKKIIPDIPASRNVLTAGTRVIAKDHGIFYGGTVLREVNRGAGEWQIESQGDVWISLLHDIRIVEPPQDCN